MVAMDQCGLGDGAGDDGLFDKAAEHEAATSRRPSVEAEREFLQVGLAAAPRLLGQDRSPLYIGAGGANRPPPFDNL